MVVMTKKNPAYFDPKTEKEFEIFKLQNLKNFKKRFGDKLINKNDLEYRPRSQKNECTVVKKAKLLISKYMESNGCRVFNEIEARIPKAPGAPKIDLCDLDKNIGIEIHWKYKKIVHSEMIKRMTLYKKYFGRCYLVLLSWGEGNAFKKAYGFTDIREENLNKYKQAEIPIIFFNVDDPKFDWLQKDLNNNS